MKVKYIFFIIFFVFITTNVYAADDYLIKEKNIPIIDIESSQYAYSEMNCWWTDYSSVYFVDNQIYTTTHIYGSRFSNTPTNLIYTSGVGSVNPEIKEYKDNVYFIRNFDGYQFKGILFPSKFELSKQYIEISDKNGNVINTFNAELFNNVYFNKYDNKTMIVSYNDNVFRADYIDSISSYGNIYLFNEDYSDFQKIEFSIENLKKYFPDLI